MRRTGMIYRVGIIAGLLIVFAAGLTAGWWLNGNLTPAEAAPLNIRPLDIPSNLLTVRIVPLAPSEAIAAELAGPDSDTYGTAQGLVSNAGLQELAESLHGVYPFNYEVGEVRELPDEYYDRERGQYRIDKVVDWLEDGHGPQDFRTIGVLAEDVYKPQFNFLFGLAGIVGPSCVASARRMGGFVPGAQTTPAERFHALAAHELGHTLGLPHNEREASLMAYSDTLNGLDRQVRHLSAGDKRRLNEILPVKWVE